MKRSAADCVLRFFPAASAMAPARRTDLGLLLVVLIWGTNFPVIKIALEPMHPFVVNALRFLFSAVVLAGLAAYEARAQRGQFVASIRRHWRQVLLLGLLGYAAYQVCFIIGVNLTSAGSAALIISSAPTWTAVIARLMGLERLPLSAWGGLGLALTGTALVVVGGSADFSGDSLGGNLLLLGGAVLWALYTVLSRPLMDAGLPATGLAFSGIVVALPVLLPLGLSAAGEVDWAEVDLAVWGAIFYSGALSTGLAYALWNAGVRAVGPSQAAIYNNLVPVVALAVGFVLLGEAVTLFQVLGGGLIIGGLLLMRRVRQRMVVIS